MIVRDDLQQFWGRRALDEPFDDVVGLFLALCENHMNALGGLLRRQSRRGAGPIENDRHRVLADGAFCVSFYGWTSADKFLQAYRAAGFRAAGHFVFPKRYTSRTSLVRYQHECAHLLVKGNPWMRDDVIGDVIDWTYSGNKLHPTQKPLSVLLPLIETFSKRGDLVLDPFSGSGSSLLAAKMLQRDWLGVELDAKYHAIAAQRLSMEVARAA